MSQTLDYFRGVFPLQPTMFEFHGFLFQLQYDEIPILAYEF